MDTEHEPAAWLGRFIGALICLWVCLMILLVATWYITDWVGMH